MLVQVVYIAYTPLPLHIHHFAKNGVTYIHILHTYCWKPSNAWHMHTHGVKHSIFTLTSQQPNSDEGVCMHFIYQCSVCGPLHCMHKYVYISDYVSIYCMHTRCVSRNNSRAHPCTLHERSSYDQKLTDSEINTLINSHTRCSQNQTYCLM